MNECVDTPTGTPENDTSKQNKISLFSPITLVEKSVSQPGIFRIKSYTGIRFYRVPQMSITFHK